MRPQTFKAASVALVSGLATLVSGLGQETFVSFDNGDFQLAGSSVGAGQILVSSDDYWGVIRAAGDLASDFGRVTGTNYTLSNGEGGASAARFTFKPVDTSNNTVFMTEAEQALVGPAYSDPDAASTVVIAGTIGSSEIIDSLIEAGKIDVSAIEGEWESFVTAVVADPIDGCEQALVIAGSMPRGTIYGIYDLSEQIGVSPWYFWADVPTPSHGDIFASLPEPKVQGPPTVKYRGIFLNDEQPGLTNWVVNNWGEAPNGAANYNHEFYGLVSELLLRLRANYLWPAIWGTIFYVDDPLNQPTVYAYEIVLGSSHTEPLMRAQNEFGTFYEGPWAYNENNATIDDYFRYGVERAKPYIRNSLFTMAMRGSGDTAIAGLGVDHILTMLETLVHNQRDIMKEVLGVDDVSEIPQTWTLYKEVQGYKAEGLDVPEDVTLLWSDDNWGNIRRFPLKNETDRSGGAGVYFHFDYVGGPRDYKWINTIQLEKTAEQLYMAHSRQADRIWIVNVGDLKPVEIPISHFMDVAYDAERWGPDATSEWIKAWVGREFGTTMVDEITSIMVRYGMYAGRRKYELVEPSTYSVINYNEADAVLAQWSVLAEDAQNVFDSLDAEYQPAFFQMVLQPALGGRIVTEISINAARNRLYASQKRNSANDLLYHGIDLLYEDSNLTMRWNEMLDGKWANMLDQTHIGYDYWQQPMRNTLPPMQFVQDTLVSLGGELRIGVEGSNASIAGDDMYHDLSSNTLTLPPLDPYGPVSRYFDVFSTGVKTCDWSASPWEPYVKLSAYNGTIGPHGDDTRVYITVDWDMAPEAPSETIVNINFTTPCLAYEKYATRESVMQLPVISRSVPESFTKGFVESDGYVSIEGPHYQSIDKAGNSSATYHTFKNYGRTYGGVGLYPMSLDKLAVSEAPALEYNMYLFTNTSAEVIFWLSPSHNFLGDWNPLEFAVALYPSGDEMPDPEKVQFVSPTVGTGMPDGWDGSVADAVWGRSDNYTTTVWEVEEEGAYTLKFWALLPSIIVQKVIVDLGGVRESYLGPPESFLVGRDEMGEYNGTAFINTPGTVGGYKDGEGMGPITGGYVDAAVGRSVGVWAFAATVLAAVMLAM